MRALLALALAAAAAAAGDDNDARVAHLHESSVFPCSPSNLTRIPAALVGDGICDCCSCSDELPATAAASAGQVPTCESVRALHAAALRASLVAVTRGRAAIPRAVSDPATGTREAQKRFGERATHARGVAEALQGEAQRLAREVQQAQQQRRKVPRATRAAAEEAAARARAAASEAQTLANLARTDFGAGGRLAALAESSNLCVAAPALSEKVAKGGSTSSTPKRYAYVICPFRNVTQLEYKPDAWVRQEARAKGQEPEKGKGGGDDDDNEEEDDDGEKEGGGTETVEVGADGEQRTAAGGAARKARKGSGSATTSKGGRTYSNPHLIGRWRGFIPLSGLADHFWGGLTKYPGVESGAVEQARLRNEYKPRAALQNGALPKGGAWELSDVAMLYEGDDTCRSEDMVATRRTYVIHVCPGVGGVPMPPADPGAMWEEAEAAAASTSPASEAAVTLAAAMPNLPRAFVPSGGFNLIGRNHSSVYPRAPAPPGSTPSSHATLARVGGYIRVVHAEERGLCQYVFYVATPLACSEKSQRGLEKALKKHGDGE
jgi:hypothetical protein